MDHEEVYTTLRMTTAIRIREITPEDSEVAAELSGQLGYPVSAEVMRQRIESSLATSNAHHLRCVHL